MRPEDVLGIWIIRSFVYENIDTRGRYHPWGEKPAGTLMLHPDGRMFAIITPGDRRPPVTDAEQADAYRNMLAYSGSFRIDPPNKLVTSVDISWHVPWIGTEQIRFCELEGETLLLKSAPLAMPEANGSRQNVYAIVAWERQARLA